MIAQEPILRPLDMERDAEKLAAMWNASDAQWPGTWNEGVPATAHSVREWHKKLDPIEVLIWDTGEELAGYCSLWNWPTEENVTYIALLNVAPGYQKLSLGRKFLTTYVDRVTERGSVRLDLHTWSGNLKAMPLYKKCGFYWLPDTSVHMLNFMPAILRMPLAQPYLEKHDWYKTYKRNLAQVEDEELLEGMKVFTYRFEEGDDSLTVWADREARAIAGIETATVSAVAIPDNIEPPRGLPTTLRWKLINKSNAPQQITLLASGNESVKINFRKSLELAAGESTVIEASVEVAQDAPDVAADMPVPSVRSVLVIDGQILELASGFRPRSAVEISSEPAYITIVPGVTTPVLLQLRSHLRYDVEATVGIVPGAGLKSDADQQSVSLPAQGMIGIPLKLQADTAGTYRLDVAIGFEHDERKIQLPASPVSIFAMSSGGLLGAEIGSKLRIENSTLRLLVSKQGGRAQLFDRASGERLTHIAGYATPPDAPSEFHDGMFSLSLERQEGEIVAVASMVAQDTPGFVLSKRIAVNAGSLLSIAYDFSNLSAEARRFKRYVVLGDPRGQESSLTLPLKTGLVSDAFSTFPGPPGEKFRKADVYAESWGALESLYGTLGLIWLEDTEDAIWWSWWEAETTSNFYDIPAQSLVRTKPVHLYAGVGGWQAVRRAWQQLTGVTDQSAIQEPVPAQNAYLDPAPILVDAEGSATLRVDNHIARKLEGDVTLVLPSGWSASPSQFELKDLDFENPFSSQVQFSTTDEPGATSGQIELRSSGKDKTFEFPLLRLGNGGNVEVRKSEVEGQKVLTIANGRLEIDVTPDFGGAVSAIREGETNNLRSPFPKVATLEWMSPWYGGLMPVMEFPDQETFPGKLGAEKWSAAPVEVAGWHGVRQSSTFQNEQLRGLSAEFDTLTVGGSNVVRHTLRLINSTSVVRRLWAGYVVYVAPDGNSPRNTLWGPFGQLNHTDWNPLLTSGHWAAAQNPATGRALALVSPLPQVRIAAWGGEGGHLDLMPSLAVPANGQVEVTGYIVLAPNIEAVRHYAALKDLKF